MRRMAFVALMLLGGCQAQTDSRALTREEVLVRISASSQAEAAPTEARLTAGVSSIAASARAAAEANARAITAVTQALTALKVAPADLQTVDVGLERIDWGSNRDRFEARNTLSIRLRDLARAGEAVAAVTEAGANVLSGPALSVGDPEAATRSAYAAAFQAARARADAYAAAAGMTVDRVIAIRDGAAMGGADPYPVGGAMAEQAAPPPVIAAPPIMPGTNRAMVTVSADFALTPKE